jgi:UDP-N-acetyl-2-amino-2-deoxyglucuronate dehydrogenase
MLKFVIIGCGRISKRHSDLLGGGEIKGATLSAVCDIDINKAKLLGQSFSVPYYLDMHKMVKDVQPDVIVVLTESGYHAKNVIDLAKYGKAIVVEKPMALTSNDAQRMIDKCKKFNSKLFVIKQNRFNVPVLLLRKAIEEKKFGKLILGTVRVRWSRNQSYYDQAPWRGTWKMDGGVLMNQACHHVDMLNWMMGDVDTVFAKGMTTLVKIEAEDTAVVMLKFKNGALGMIEATTATRPNDLEGSISILGEKGTVEIGGFAVNKLKTWNFVNDSDNDKIDFEKNSSNPPNVYGFGHKAYYEHVVQNIEKNNTFSIDGSEGIKSILLLNAIYESMATGKEIKMGTELNHKKLKDSILE